MVFFKNVAYSVMIRLSEKELSESTDQCVGITVVWDHLALPDKLKWSVFYDLAASSFGYTGTPVEPGTSACHLILTTVYMFLISILLPLK